MKENIENEPKKILIDEIKKGLRNTIRELNKFWKRQNPEELKLLLPQLIIEYHRFYKELYFLNKEHVSDFKNVEEILEIYGIHRYVEFTPERYFQILDNIDWEKEIPTLEKSHFNLKNVKELYDSEDERDKSKETDN